MIRIRESAGEVTTTTTKRSKNLGRRLAVAFLFLPGLWFFSWLGARLLLVEAPLDRADAIVVLSGSKMQTERAELAAGLYHNGVAKRIFVTNDNHRGGWNSAEQRNPYFFETTIAALRSRGVPDDAIGVIPQAVDGTHAEAVVLREYADEQGLQSLLVVTSGYHSRRALRSFRRAFAGSGRTVGLRAVSPGQQTPPASTWWLKRRGWEMVAGEYLKLAYYVVRW